MKDIPINRSDDGELLGLIRQVPGGWESRTIFGYVFARSSSREDAEQIVREQGLRVLKDLWHYLDPDEADWFPCILQVVTPDQVTVIRTNAMGYQEPARYKRVEIKRPDDTRLIKA